jgi:hypothetical protein
MKSFPAIVLLAAVLAACAQSPQERASLGAIAGIAIGGLVGGPIGAIAGAGVGIAGGAAAPEASQAPEKPQGSQS